MPNRILRDAALDSDRLASVDEGAECLFFRLIMLADDFGRFDGRVSVIRGRAFALRQQVAEKEIDRRLTQLSTAGLILRYEVAGKPFIQIPRFGQRQRAEKSKFPAMPDGWQPNDGQPSDGRKTSAPVVVVEGVYEGVVEDGGEGVKTLVAFTLPDWVNPETWKAWLEVRKAKRAKNSEYALTLALKDLVKLKAAGEDPQAVLEQSILRSYTGLFPVKGAGGAQDLGVSKQAQLEARNAAVVRRILEKDADGTG